ncbi:MAG: phenylalanine--tRNA ligase subunit beta, partial [Clostridia bacterium]
MKVSLNWLKDFVDIDVDTATLAQKLVSAGFEVEEIIDQAANMKNVLLGKIEKLEKHPDADKLQICQINVGATQNVQIVTGAQNIAVGDLVPVAMDNSLLPTGQVIKKGKLRGIDSCGMLCSGEELKLSESDYVGAGVYGILIMNKETAPVGTDLNVLFGNDDIILDVGVTANRSDCNSVLGIAREVATVLKKPLKMPNIDVVVDDKKSVNDFVKVSVEDKILCPRYMAGAVFDVKIMPSDKLIQKRLRAVGLRPINNIVDITNYVLVEIGQPMHAFDKNILCGGKIVVRRAVDGEKIVALDEKEYILDKDMLAICDDCKPCAIAGVMGGQNSGVNCDTKEIVFESAKFLRDNIRRTSRKLNLRSDSSFRYERGIDFDSQRLGLMRALSLICKYGYGKVAKGAIDILSGDISQKTINVPTQKINNILGIVVPENTMVEILNSLQIVTTLKDGVLTCAEPPFRDDIENANDLAEEIIRLYGYDKIVCTLMDKGQQTIGGKTQNQQNVDTIKEIAVSQGFSETLTYSFVAPKSFDMLNLPLDSELRNALKLLNPLGEDLSVMRTTLVGSMLNCLASNNLKSNKNAKLFEVASVYLPKSKDAVEQPQERCHLVLGAYGDKVDYFTLKGVIEIIAKKFGICPKYIRSNLSFLHTGRSAQIVVGDDVVGFVGEVHPTVAGNFDVKDKMYIAEIDIDEINKLADYKYKFVAISKFPPMERDIAIVVKEDICASQI